MVSRLGIYLLINFTKYSNFYNYLKYYDIRGKIKKMTRQIKVLLIYRTIYFNDSLTYTFRR